MANRILDRTANAVTFEVDAQCYKAGRFTMPAEVLRHLGLEWNEEVRLRIESLDGQRVLWAGILKMQSGPEIDSSELMQYIGPGKRIRIVAYRN
jgi:hypothetical protein